MNKLSVLIASTLMAGAVFAAPNEASTPAASASAKTPTAQQSRMADCHKEAADKKGDERKAFMKECLSNKTADKKDEKKEEKAADKSTGKPAPTAAQTAQRDRMKSCNKDAAGKKGDERKQFMKDCLAKK